MSTYGYLRENTKHNREKIPFILYFISVTIIAFLFWSSFNIALFNGQSSSFDKPIYIASLMTSIISLISIIAFRNSIRMTKQSDLLKWFVLLLPVSYTLSLLTAASKYLAINMLIIMIMYSLFFILTIIITQNSNINSIIKSALLTNAYLIVAFGFIHVLGNVSFLRPILNFIGAKLDSSGNYLDAVMLTNDGLRLTSVFQYANTYAAFLMAFLFCALFLIGSSKSFWGKSIHAFMLVPMILSILLTLSRGGLVLLPAIFIFLLVFLKPHRQIMWILYVGISGLFTLIILNPVSKIGLELQNNFNASQSFNGWGIVILASVFSAAIIIILERFLSPVLEIKLERLTKNKWGHFILPIGVIALSGIMLLVFMGSSLKSLLPETIQTRLSNINFSQNSVLERLTFYKDSAKLLADHPLIGGGGGAWGAMYEQYQNNPYTSRQAHSFYMQYLNETGLIGFILFAAFLGYILYQYIRTYIRADQERRDQYFMYFIIAASILIHSVMDFNMSYVFIGILVFICLGGMTASIESKPLNKLKSKPKSIRTCFSILTGVISLALLITSITFITASSSYEKAEQVIQSSNDYYEIVTPLNEALSIRPNHPDYVALKSSLLIQVYTQTQDELYYETAYDSLQDTLKSEPYNKQLWMQLNSLYATKQLEEDIFEVLDSNKFRYPWDIQWYEEYMSVSARLASASLADEAQKDKYITAVMESLAYIEDGIEHLQTLPEGQLQGRTFEITPKVALHAGQAYYLNGQTQEAYDIMLPRLQEDLTDPDNLVLMRWYLASALKLGLQDEANYQKLMAVNPNESESIQSLVNMPIE